MGFIDKRNIEILINSLHFPLPDINECSSAPCANAATCHNEMNGFRCTCAPGWMGIQCTQGRYDVRSSKWSSNQN